MLIKIIIISIFAYIFTVNSVLAVETLRFNGFISDNANILSESTESNLNNTLKELRDKTKAEVAVVTLNSLNNNPIEDTALQIFRKYKFGDKTLNNGALFLIVPSERKVKFEIGYGLEGVITDSKAGRILDYYVIPKFKQNDYEAGIINGTMVLANDIAKSYGQTLSVSPSTELLSSDNQQENGINIPDIIGIIIICIMPLLFMYVFLRSVIAALKGERSPFEYNVSGRSSSKRSGSSRRSSSSSSSSSFGGGSSGGGGSSRSW